MRKTRELIVGADRVSESQTQPCWSVVAVLVSNHPVRRWSVREHLHIVCATSIRKFVFACLAGEVVNHIWVVDNESNWSTILHLCTILEEVAKTTVNHIVIFIYILQVSQLTIAFILLVSSDKHREVLDVRIAVVASNLNEDSRFDGRSNLVGQVTVLLCQRHEQVTSIFSVCIYSNLTRSNQLTRSDECALISLVCRQRVLLIYINLDSALARYNQASITDNHFLQSVRSCRSLKSRAECVDWFDWAICVTGIFTKPPAFFIVSVSLGTMIISVSRLLSSIRVICVVRHWHKTTFVNQRCVWHWHNHVRISHIFFCLAVIVLVLHEEHIACRAVLSLQHRHGVNLQAVRHTSQILSLGRIPVLLTTAVELHSPVISGCIRSTSCSVNKCICLEWFHPETVSIVSSSIFALCVYNIIRIKSTCRTLVRSLQVLVSLLGSGFCHSGIALFCHLCLQHLSLRQVLLDYRHTEPVCKTLVHLFTNRGLCHRSSANQQSTG